MCETDFMKYILSTTEQINANNDITSSAIKGQIIPTKYKTVAKCELFDTVSRPMWPLDLTKNML
jgi:hypothetical protein